MAVYDFTIETTPNSTVYWESVAYMVAQYPTLANSSVAAFTYLYPNTSAAGLGGDKATFQAVFALYDPDSSTRLENLLEPYVQHINNSYPSLITTTVASTVFPNFHSMFLEFADDSGAGVDKVVGSWLLPPDTLKEDAFSNALVDFLGPAGGRLYMVSGSGVWDAKPRGGSNAINPAWRKALVHAGKSSYIVLS
jgi:phytoene dehydrogenase-like protein